jgi:hypothetical protein
VLPRDIVRRFECRAEGRAAVCGRPAPAIAANPYVAFTLRAGRALELELLWLGDQGFRHVTGPAGRAVTGGAVAVGGRTAHPGPAGAWTVLAARAPGLRFLALMPALLALPLAPAEAGGASDARRSGFEHMSPATQALQRDDSLNPAWLWVLDGQRLWTQPAGATGRACASCHGDAADSMRAVAARYPAFDERSGRPVNLAGRIDACRVRHQQAAAAGAEDKALLALQAYVALQSRGLPMAPPADARLATLARAGPRTVHPAPGAAGPVVRDVP